MEHSKRGSANRAENIIEDRINKAIDAKKHQVREVLIEIEANFRKSIEGHITYHKYLMSEAKEHGDLATAIRHQVMVETYEAILRNYSLSGSYDKV